MGHPQDDGRAMARYPFTCFYPSPPFWACSAVDFDVPRVSRWFDDQMAEEVFSKETDTFALKVCRDGEILIRVESLEGKIARHGRIPTEDTVRHWGEYLNYLNAFYLILDSAALEVDRHPHFNLHEVTRNEAFRANYENGRSLFEGIRPESIASVYERGRFAGNYRSEAAIEQDPIIFMRKIVSREAILHASSLFERVVEQPGAEKDLASLAKSLSEYKVGHFDTSVILSWFIAESAMNTLWKTHIENLNETLSDGSKRVNSGRMDTLTGHGFTAMVVSNILELFGVLDRPLFGEIDSTRNCRNKIVHSSDNYRAKAEDAQRAMKVAASMIERIWNMSITLNISYQILGL